MHMWQNVVVFKGGKFVCQYLDNGMGYECEIFRTQRQSGLNKYADSFCDYRP